MNFFGVSSQEILATFARHSPQQLLGRVGDTFIRGEFRHKSYGKNLAGVSPQQLLWKIARSLVTGGTGNNWPEFRHKSSWEIL